MKRQPSFAKKTHGEYGKCFSLSLVPRISPQPQTQRRGEEGGSDGSSGVRADAREFEEFQISDERETAT